MEYGGNGDTELYSDVLRVRERRTVPMLHQGTCAWSSIHHLVAIIWTARYKAYLWQCHGQRDFICTCFQHVATCVYTQVHTKVFYFDIKSNSRGRYLKLSEKGMARAHSTCHHVSCSFTASKALCIFAERSDSTKKPHHARWVWTMTHFTLWQRNLANIGYESSFSSNPYEWKAEEQAVKKAVHLTALERGWWALTAVKLDRSDNKAVHHWLINVADRPY